MSGMRVAVAASILFLNGVACDKKGPFYPQLQNLTDPDPSRRALAASLIGDMGNDAKSCIKDLKKLLKDDNPYVRVKAADAIRRIDGTLTDEVMPVFCREIDGDEMVFGDASKARNFAIEVIETCGPAAKNARKLLEKRLQGTFYERAIATRALVRISPEVEDAWIDGLREQLRSDKRVVRQIAISSAGMIGPRAKLLINDLSRIIMGPDKELAEAANVSLRAIMKGQCWRPAE